MCPFSDIKCHLVLLQYHCNYWTPFTKSPKSYASIFMKLPCTCWDFQWMIIKHLLPPFQDKKQAQLWKITKVWLLQDIMDEWSGMKIWSFAVILPYFSSKSVENSMRKIHFKFRGWNPNASKNRKSGQRYSSSEFFFLQRMKVAGNRKYLEVLKLLHFSWGSLVGKWFRHLHHWENSNGWKYWKLVTLETPWQYRAWRYQKWWQKMCMHWLKTLNFQCNI